MGMFSSLFGKSGSDKADKMRQRAIDAFNAIQTPDLKNLQVQLDKYVQQGLLSPEQAEAKLLQSNAFNDIVTDPELEGAQKQALSELQRVSTEGGLTAVDRARLADITDQQNQEARGRNEAIMQSARERGTGSSDMNLINQLINEQSAADRASKRGLDVAALAQDRALQSMISEGNLAGGIRGQDYAEEAKKAEAENAIDLFNKQTLNQTNLYNVEAANKAQAANLAEKQRVADTNANIENQNKLYNAAQYQQDFKNKMDKAQGMAGTYNAWAGDANQAAATDKAADVGFTTGMIKAGATGLGSAFANSAVPPVTIPDAAPQRSTNSAYKRNPDGSYNFNCGGEVKPVDYEEGGRVGGVAPVAGDSPKNDVVPARLSPGEVVVPRSAMTDEDEFNKFMEQFRPKKNKKLVDETVPMEYQALENLHKRVSALEGK